MAHVALTHDTAPRGIFRNVVRTLEDTVLAADALIIEMTHDAGVFIFFISEHRAAIETGRVYAVMAGSGDNLLVRLRFCSPVQQSDVTPGFLLVEAIERMAGADASLAASAGVEVDGEGVLLAGTRPFERD
jgi:hypothetical protein